MRAYIATPATIANLGPGFDILAVAVQLQNEVRCAARDDGVVTVSAGDDMPAELRDPQRNLVTRAYAHACAAGGVSGGADFACVNRVPFARGLGSSAAAALAGVLAAVALHRLPWDEQTVIDTVSQLEGHRDNAAAALLGGLAVCAPGAPAVRVDVPDRLRVIVYVPEAGLDTHAARDVVPTRFSRDDAVHNAARCALLVRALALNDLELLGDAMEDRWHQPARTALVPALPALIAAARDAGAAGAALAGAGPSVVALTAERDDDVASALQRTADVHGVAGTVMRLAVRNFGARVDVGP